MKKISLLSLRYGSLLINYRLFVYALFLLSYLSPTDQAQAQEYQWARRGGNKTVSAVDSDGAGNSYLLTSFSGSVSFGPYTFTALGNSYRTDLCLVKYDKDGNVLWARRIGGTGNEDLGDVTISQYGGYLYITGTFEQTVRFGSYHGYMVSPLTSRGSKDIFVARYETSGGVFQWARQAGGSSSDVANGIFTDKYGEEVFITGSFSGTATFRACLKIFYRFELQSVKDSLAIGPVYPSFGTVCCFLVVFIQSSIEIKDAKSLLSNPSYLHRYKALGRRGTRRYL